MGDDYDMTMDFTKAKKKKGKKKKHDLEDLINVDMDQDEKNNENEAGHDWAGSDRDYSYDELLNRAFDQLREKNPEMATGEKKKFVMKPPQVVRIGSKKTAFANFSEICRLLHRMPKHVLQFLLAELGTSGSIDGNNQLIIKGRFQQKQFCKKMPVSTSCNVNSATPDVLLLLLSLVSRLLQTRLRDRPSEQARTKLSAKATGEALLTAFDCLEERFAGG